VRAETATAQRRLYVHARVLVARNYARPLTLATLARTLSSSPRQLQRAYAQFGRTSFREDLHARRMAAAAQLLAEQRSIPVRDVARLVGYRQAPHFARVFHRRFGMPPARFRRRAAQAAERSRAALVPSRSAGARSAPGGSGSALGSDMRISVPPPGAGSAPTLPPSCSAT
jgi:AraC-like DNA-binding protein